MDWVILVGLVWIAIGQFRIERRFHTMSQELRAFRTRQSQVAQARMNRPGPTIQKARTTVRDTNDLPATGRMVAGVKMSKVNNARNTDDR